MKFEPYLNQDYEKLKNEHLASGKLFQDDKFPPVLESFSKFRKPKVSLIWKRPHEIVDNPQFIVDGAKPSDLIQGSIGMAAVALYPEYLKIVVPEDQFFDEKNYAGIFHFRFWKNGVWVDVVIDDYLPVNSETNKLVVCKNKNQINEFWGSLLEKAYAKLNICYEFLCEGFVQDGIIDMTGGIPESFNLIETYKNVANSENDPYVSGNKEKIWKAIHSAFKLKSLSGAAIVENLRQSKEEASQKGLVASHIYSISNIVEISEKDEKIINLRNPWGDHHEWNGLWSDFCYKWNEIEDDIKQKLDYKSKDDGEFWISYEDFLKNFDSLYIVHIDLNAFYDPKNPNEKYKNWTSKQFFGKCLSKNKDGSSYYNNEFSHKNPQYFLNLTNSSENDNKISLIISLSQTNYSERRLINNGHSNNELIQASLYKVINNELINRMRTQNDTKFEHQDLKFVGNTGIHSFFRHVTRHFKVDPGDYVIIPSTISNDDDFHYLLRVFIEDDVNLTNQVIDLNETNDLSNLNNSNHSNLTDLFSSNNFKETHYDYDDKTYSESEYFIDHNHNLDLDLSNQVFENTINENSDLYKFEDVSSLYFNQINMNNKQKNYNEDWITEPNTEFTNIINESLDIHEKVSINQLENLFIPNDDNSDLSNLNNDDKHNEYTEEDVTYFKTDSNESYSNTFDFKEIVVSLNQLENHDELSPDNPESTNDIECSLQEFNSDESQIENVGLLDESVEKKQNDS